MKRADYQLKKFASRYSIVLISKKPAQLAFLFGMAGQEVNKGDMRVWCQASRGKECDARQECQAWIEKSAMPGKNARHGGEKSAMPGKNARHEGEKSGMPGMKGKECDARQKH
ncbi:hypothetical protein [Metabacillus sp. FJAT-52054]|uniref:Uncharacterized protein n=1 Tax=Metabacillus sediminis TaxID=3117746 RepID=A0ABZ2NLG5_9BACI